MLPLVFRSPWAASVLAVTRWVALAGCWVALVWTVVANLGISGRIAWFLEIPANFPAFVWAAIVAGTAGIWLLGGRVTRIVVFVPALAAIAVGMATAPRIQTVEFGRSDGEIALMTWNAMAGALDSAAVAAEIRRMNPDLVAFTEFTPDFRAEIGPLLAEDFPYHLESARRGHVGNGVYSRLPISDWRRLPERRAAATFRLDLPNGRSCALLLLHPDVPVQGGYARRAEFLRSVSAAISGSDGPLIVLGDFNASWASADFREFCARHDLMVASRLVPTWNAGAPRLLRAAIDHVLASQGDFSSIFAESGNNGLGGDHLPVMATIRVE